MKVVFWLLDVNYEKREEIPEIWMWGINASGERILVIDRSFVDYFYAVVKEDREVMQVAEDIKCQHHASIEKLEIVERKHFGKPVKALKVYCKNPDETAKLAKSLRNLESIEDCFEDDVRFSMRYLIDNNISPCGWHEVEAFEEEPDANVSVDKTFVAKSAPKASEKTSVPKLRTLAFSIIRYSREGSPKAHKDPVVIISTANSSGEEKQFLADEAKNDKQMLETFIEHVQKFNPDIIVGYGSNERDWPYLRERCKKLRLPLHVDRTKTEPHKSTYGHVSVTGRANIDLADYADEFPEVKVKTLENLADYLGAAKTEKRTIIEEIDYAEHWESTEKRELLKKFSQENTRSIMMIADAVLDFATQLSFLVGLPLDHVGTAAAGLRVEWFIIKNTRDEGELVPRRTEQPYMPYTGGIVLSPKPGLHEKVAVLDFKSMYPNLMITYNLSPDSYVSPNMPEPTTGVYVAPEVGHKFRRQSDGFFKKILLQLIKARSEIRSKMNEFSPESAEYRVLDARQKAVKVITNATYGYAGWVGARWYIKPVAEATAAWGRHVIQTTIKMAETAGLKVVYGDTDSIFIAYEKKKVEQLSKEIQAKLGLEVELDKVYERVFFTEAKKRYAGLLSDGKLDIVGLEAMRGDWAMVAKTVQEEVLTIVLKERSPEKAKAFVKQFISDLRQKRIAYHDLVIWKTLTKPPSEYEVKAAHVEASKMLKEKGWDLTVGDKVGYVIVKGSGRLYERVKPYMLASYDEVDIEYYVTKQVVPAAARVLESFGVTEEQLLSVQEKSEGKKLLTDFFET
ncbi:DNA polymerase II [Candidatus Bathyarchaeota archaeon]|nr:DNA polymerase II [Candidatus Bathyarchaeota archaeon]